MKKWDQARKSNNGKSKPKHRAEQLDNHLGIAKQISNQQQKWTIRVNKKLKLKQENH